MLVQRAPTASRAIFPRIANVTYHERPRNVSDRLFDLKSFKKHYASGQELLGEGEVATSVFKVVWGVVRVYRSLGNGNRKVDAFRLPGDVFGFELEDRCPYSADAINSVCVLVVRRDLITARASEDCGASQELCTAIAGELGRIRDHALLLAKNARERLACFLLEMHERLGHPDAVDLPMSRLDIADYLGLTIETVSRMMTQFEAAGLIEMKTSRRVTLGDLQALQQMIR